MAKREPIEEVTLMRALAFMAITMQHCIAEYIYRPDILPPDEIMLAMLFHFTRFGTPTFVFLSGLILFYNYSERFNYRKFLVNRFTYILVPFLIWTLIYWVSASVSLGISMFDGATWIELGKQLVLPTYGYHLWFILMIFQFYLIMPILLKLADPIKNFVQRNSNRAMMGAVWILAPSAIVYAGMLWLSYYKAELLMSGASGIWEWLIVQRSRLFLFYFFYFMLGAVCSYGLARFRHAAVRTLVWNGLLFIGMYVWMGYVLLGVSMDGMKLNASSYLRPETYLLIMSQLVATFGITVLLERYGGVFRRFMLFVGRHSFGGFLAHVFVLMLVSVITRPLDLTGYHLPVAVATFFIVAATSVGISKTASLLPFGWLLTGAQGKRRVRIKSHSAGSSIKGGLGRIPR